LIVISTKFSYKTHLTSRLKIAVTDGKVTTDSYGGSRYIVVVGQRDGLNVLEVGGVKDDELIGRPCDRRATGHHHTVCFLTDRYAERLNIQLSLLELTANIQINVTAVILLAIST